MATHPPAQQLRGHLDKALAVKDPKVRLERLVAIRTDVDSFLGDMRVELGTAIQAAYDEGEMTWQAIADVLGVSAQRAKQLTEIVGVGR